MDSGVSETRFKVGLEVKRVRQHFLIFLSAVYGQFTTYRGFDILFPDISVLV